MLLYIDPSKVTYMIQAIAAIIIAGVPLTIVGIILLIDKINKKNKKKGESSECEPTPKQ